MLQFPAKISVRKQTRCFIRMISQRRVMPRDRPHISELQEVHREKKKKRLEKSEGPAYLQITGSGANGAPRSLYFSTDYCRYIFNMGEGTQRLVHEYKLKLTRLEHIFITQAVWKNIGGLLGFALTVQDGGLPEVYLHGPDGLEKLFNCADRFVCLSNMKVTMTESGRGSTFTDPMVTIKDVPLIPTQKANWTENGEGSVTEDMESEESSRRENSTSSCTPAECRQVSSLAVSYICRMKDKPGRLNLEACVDKNIPPGPLLGKLKNGYDVTLPDGTIVRAADVKDPDEIGALFIVVDCPSEDYLDSLLKERLFRVHQMGAKTEDVPKYVFHFTPSSVMKHEAYRNWMKRFNESTLHVNLNEDNKCLGFVGTHELQYKLNMIDANIFPLLKDDSLRRLTQSIPSESEQSEVLKRDGSAIDEPDYISTENLRRKDFDFGDSEGNTLRVLPLRNSDVIEKNVMDCVFLNPCKYMADVTSKAEYDEEKNTLQSKLKLVNPYHPEREYPRITFLGTGSCIPNKYRNASAILVSMAYDNHIILDCGEGTFGQLVRHFGLARATEIVARTNIIFVSHIHADHHLGFVHLLNRRKKAVKDVDQPLHKVMLLGPKTMEFWLRKYENYFENIFDDVDYVDLSLLEYRSTDGKQFSKVISVAPLEDLKVAYVTHCPYSFGIAITHSNGTKITYSGDTMPTKTLVNIGANSNLLIHEATFEDDLIREARSKTHSTFSEAIEMGQNMKADFTILTHFSQRYSKIPVFSNKFNEKVGVAFDNMEICLNDLPKLHLFVPLLKLIFEEEMDELEFKTEKRRRLALLEE